MWPGAARRSAGWFRVPRCWRQKSRRGRAISSPPINAKRCASAWRLSSRRSCEGSLAALFQARDAQLSGSARGLAFQLGEALGSLPAEPASPLVASLASSDRKRLSLLGVRFGVESIYIEPLLKPEAVRMRGLLWALKSGQPVPRSPKGSAAPRDPAIAAAAYDAMGYRVLGSRILRLDRVERLAARARALARQGAFAALPELAHLAGCAAADLPGALAALGYRSANPDGKGVVFRAAAPARPRGVKPGPQEGPFAKLRELTLAR